MAEMAKTLSDDFSVSRIETVDVQSRYDTHADWFRNDDRIDDRRVSNDD
jgi:hypothetical protein